MRVMFVDDERCVLEGIERALFALDVDWEMEFVTSGRAALDQLGREPVHAVITDMRLPCMGGRELRTEVRARWPDTLRIVLSGFTEEEAALRSLEVVHQFLAKPCDGTVLVALVERVAALRDLLGSPTLKRIVGRIGHLPPTPLIYCELLRCISNANASAKSVAGVLSRDPALSAKVLQVANSAFFRRGKSVADIGAAVTHIGTDVLRSLVLMVEVFAAENDEGAAAHLQQRAMRAMLIAERIGAGEAFFSEGMTAALLCEVGLLVPGIDAYCREAETNGEGRFRYPEVGAYLLGIWGLPTIIIEAVAHHQNPMRTKPQGFDAVGVAHVAAALARGAEPDRDYLALCGRLDQLDRWKQYAEQLD